MKIVQQDNGTDVFSALQFNLQDWCEYHDVLLNSLEELEKSIALIQGAKPAASADFKLQDI